MRRMQTTLDKINRSHAELIAAEAHLMYEVRRTQRSEPRKSAMGSDGGASLHSVVSAAPMTSSRTPAVRFVGGESLALPASGALDVYIARAEALVRPTGELEPGAEDAALALLCSIVAARRTADPAAH